MAVKTITIDMESYSLLASRKRSGESFSKVIKRTLGEERKTGKNLLLHLKDISVSNDFLDNMDEMAAERKAEYPEDVNL
ncbi:MAG: antitoxin VapB family protein [Spirochaetales bacterium]|nr:antitoxin VapB family protein [Spirochaetales bacterium]